MISLIFARTVLSSRQYWQNSFMSMCYHYIETPAFQPKRKPVGLHSQSRLPTTTPRIPDPEDEIEALQGDGCCSRHGLAAETAGSFRLSTQFTRSEHHHRITESAGAPSAGGFRMVQSTVSIFAFTLLTAAHSIKDGWMGIPLPESGS